MKYKYKICIPAFLTIAMMLTVFGKMGFFFETNDERCITEMLSGTVTQVPDAHVQVINYLLALPLTWLYRITWQIPWYGICLILFHGISWFFILERFFSCFRKIAEMAVGAGLCAGLFLISLYNTSLLQFTSTAALLAIAGYISIIPGRSSRAFLQFTCLELLAFLLRKESMLMIQPFGLAVWLGLLAGRHLWKKREERMFLYKAGLALTGILLTGSIGNWLGYGGAEWREYEEYNQARIALFDYYGTPEYEEVKDILDKYHVNETEYQAYRSYILTGNSIDAECAAELAAYAEEKSSGKPDVSGLVGKALEIIFRKDGMSAGFLVGRIWLCAVIWALVSGSFYLLWPMAGLGAAHTCVWCYLLYKGRTPNRVTYPLFFCEIVFVLLLIVLSYPDRERKWLQRVAVLLICGVFGFNACETGIHQYRYVCAVNEGQAVYIEGLKEIREYCMSHQEKRYLLDNVSFSYYYGSALETDIYRPGNAMYTGGWNGNSPAFRAYGRAYYGDDMEDICVMIYDDGRPPEEQADCITVRYFTEKTGREPSLDDQFSVSNGACYIVWHF